VPRVVIGGAYVTTPTRGGHFMIAKWPVSAPSGVSMRKSIGTSG
jgi:hypothetical protein